TQPTAAPPRALSFPHSCARAHRHLHSFPTRRSSDLADDLLELRRRLGDHAAVLTRPLARYRRAGSAGRDQRRHLLPADRSADDRSEEHTSELQSPYDLVCRLLLEKKKKDLVTNIDAA